MWRAGGVIVKPISSARRCTRTDETFHDIINYGSPTGACRPLAPFGGELSPDEIMAIVTFMATPGTTKPSFPRKPPQPSALPTSTRRGPPHEVHMQPMLKRFCVSCHREGKENNNYLMGTYTEVLESGDNAPNFIAGDLGSNVIRMLHREEIDAGGPMPPTKPLKDEYIQIFERWVLAGMPETAAQAAELSPAGPAAGETLPAGTAEATPEVTPTP
jgi:hypothetical protein